MHFWKKIPTPPFSWPLHPSSPPPSRTLPGSFLAESARTSSKDVERPFPPADLLSLCDPHGRRTLRLPLLHMTKPWWPSSSLLPSPSSRAPSPPWLLATKNAQAPTCSHGAPSRLPLLAMVAVSSGSSLTAPCLCNRVMKQSWMVFS